MRSRQYHSVSCMAESVMFCFIQGFEDKPLGKDGNKEPKLQTVKNKILRKSRSSGNFGSAGARSAPSTPNEALCLPSPVEAFSQPSTPGYALSTVQSSPSHSNLTKCDKISLKHLSTSTPIMTAQAQVAEPPSPKATKEPKVHTTSKARQKKFLRHFPNVDEDEKVLNHYSCALVGDILLQGHLYITKNYFAFYSNVFGYVTKLLIPILTVENITKEKTARIIPNAVGICTSEDKHVFGSLISRDSALAYIRTVWEKAKSASPVILEPEIEDPDLDSSDSIDNESGRDSPPPDIKRPTFSLVKRLIKDPSINTTEVNHGKGIVQTLKDAIIEFQRLPRQNLILYATTLLLVLLFFSAGVLLYRISRIQNRYSLVLQENMVRGSKDIYSDLLQWHNQLHSKSAGAVNTYLDSNLDLIAQVRKSLETLSNLLVMHDKNPSLQDGTLQSMETAKDNS